MGCSKGNIYSFDPWLMGECKISKYYYSQPPCAKRRRVEIIKWLEPKNESENVSLFLVVYEDGTFCVFDSKIRTDVLE